MTLSSRPYREPSDLVPLQTFVMQAAGGEPDHGYFQIGDLVWGLYQNTSLDPAKTIQLWLEDDRIIGMLFAHAPGVVGYHVDRQHPEQVAIIGQMLDRLEAGNMDTFELAGQRVAMAVMETDATMQAALTARGFAFDEYWMNHYVYPLTDALPAVALPPGYSVRPVGGADEWPARVDLHREVWAPSKVTLPAYERLRAAPAYRPDLDLVVVAPDGTLAAYCICWHDPVNGTGEFEPVGTRPAAQGLGLGKAIIAAGLQRLRALGAQVALVYTPEDNEAAKALYRSAGFEVRNRHLFWSKVIG